MLFHTRVRFGIDGELKRSVCGLHNYVQGAGKEFNADLVGGGRFGGAIQPS